MQPWLPKKPLWQIDEESGLGELITHVNEYIFYKHSKVNLEFPLPTRARSKSK